MKECLIITTDKWAYIDILSTQNGHHPCKKDDGIDRHVITRVNAFKLLLIFEIKIKNICNGL
jgi:hypothetical protein